MSPVQFDYKNATRQSIFDYVSKHLIKQDTRAVDAYNNCQYRTDVGISCAVGCLIPDKIYTNVIEGRVVRELPNYIEDEQFNKFIKDNLELLEELQNAHDYFFKNIDTLKKELNIVATIFNLNTEVLKETK